MFYPVWLYCLYLIAVHGNALLRVKRLRSSEHYPCCTGRHVLKHIFAWHEVRHCMCDIGCHLGQHLVVLIQEYCSHGIAVDAWPTNLFHAGNAMPVNVSIIAFAEILCRERIAYIEAGDRDSSTGEQQQVAQCVSVDVLGC